jgi:hypothetical protein
MDGGAGVTCAAALPLGETQTASRNERKRCGATSTTLEERGRDQGAKPGPTYENHKPLLELGAWQARSAPRTIHYRERFTCGGVKRM